MIRCRRTIRSAARRPSAVSCTPLYGTCSSSPCSESRLIMPLTDAAESSRRWAMSLVDAGRPSGRETPDHLEVVLDRAGQRLVGGGGHVWSPATRARPSRAARSSGGGGGRERGRCRAGRTTRSGAASPRRPSPTGMATARCPSRAVGEPGESGDEGPLEDLPPRRSLDLERGKDRLPRDRDREKQRQFELEAHLHPLI